MPLWMLCKSDMVFRGLIVKRLNDGEHSEFFVAGDPVILGIGGLEPFDGRFDFATSERECFGRQLPNTAAIRFLLIDGDDVHGNVLPDHLGKHILVECKLVVVSETPGVGFEPNKVVAGFQIDDTKFRIRPVDPYLTR